MAEALAWLWRLGPVADEPTAGSICFGEADEYAELDSALAAGRAAGAVILAHQAGLSHGALPARRMAEGVARFAPAARVHDSFVVFADGRPVVRTRVGLHVVELDRGAIAIGCDLAGRWGRLGALWALSPIEDYLAATLDRPLVKLPRLGAIRLDDAPGTAQMQLQDRDKTDEVAAKRIDRLLRTYRSSGAPLSVAVAARGLRDGQPVPAEEVWPRGIAAMARGIEAGVFEPIGHGWLHYDPDAGSEGAIEPREFARLSEEEAGHRIDAVLEWQTRTFGVSPRTFVAPAWGYSEGALRALAERSLPAWHRAAPEPLLVDGNPRETLIGPGGRGGVHRLDYGSLERLAAAGVPPTPALHGGLMDDRLEYRIIRDAAGYARLMAKRDAHRLPSIPGIRWIGARELYDRYAAHDAIEVDGGELQLVDGAEAVVRDRDGERTVRG